MNVRKYSGFSVEDGHVHYKDVGMALIEAVHQSARLRRSVAVFGHIGVGGADGDDRIAVVTAADYAGIS